jgi:predicted TIM-barrel fold metal-dependent hydrolase
LVLGRANGDIRDDLGLAQWPRSAQSPSAIELRVIVDHMGLERSMKGKDLAGCRSAARSRFDNVGVKVSCLPCYADEPIRTRRSIRRSAAWLAPSARKNFGAPICRSPCSYRQNVTLFTEALDFLSSSDKEWIMGKALAQWLRWPI